MDATIGRILWDSLQVATGIRESGEALVRLGDVDIQRIQQTRREQLMIEASTKFTSAYQERKDDMAAVRKEMSAVVEEIRNRRSTDEDLDRIVKIWFRKTVWLGGRFKLGLGEFTESTTGVGLFGELQDAEMFSWEWFVVESPGSGKKLQETGEIYFETATSPLGQEMAFLRFESDVSIRMSVRGAPPDRQPTWRINVKQGSEIYWPFLADEAKKATGHM